VTVAISVENLGKRYRVGEREPYRSLRDSLARAARAPFRVVRRLRRRGGKPREQFWALRHVGFELREGEVLGIIGRNGAGKSTLLKMLCRITEPTEGEARIRGRVGSLLEVGTGFHPELTGRENVFLNGAILGMAKREIARKFDEIVTFAGVERFIDTPVKRYSSGMHMRLAFAVAAHLDTEVLLVDEVLAVGDAVFQLKCLTKMSEVSGSGRTILFVSHNLDAVKQLCHRGILLEGGEVAFAGTPSECVERYLLGVRDKGAVGDREISLRTHPGRTSKATGPIRLTGVTVSGPDDAPWVARCGEPLEVTLSYDLAPNVAPQRASFVVTFVTLEGQRITTCLSSHTRGAPISVDKSGQVVCRVPRFPFVPGFYTVTVGCFTEAGASDGVYDAAEFEVVGDAFYRSRAVNSAKAGHVLVDHEWTTLGSTEMLDGE